MASADGLLDSVAVCELLALHGLRFATKQRYPKQLAHDALHTGAGMLLARVTLKISRITCLRLEKVHLNCAWLGNNLLSLVRKARGNTWAMFEGDLLLNNAQYGHLKSSAGRIVQT